jgi:hypothetical protein
MTEQVSEDTEIVENPGEADCGTQTPPVAEQEALAADPPTNEHPGNTPAAPRDHYETQPPGTEEAGARATTRQVPAIPLTEIVTMQPLGKVGATPPDESEHTAQRQSHSATDQAVAPAADSIEQPVEMKIDEPEDAAAPPDATKKADASKERTPTTDSAVHAESKETAREDDEPLPPADNTAEHSSKANSDDNEEDDVKPEAEGADNAGDGGGGDKDTPSPDDAEDDPDKSSPGEKQITKKQEETFRRKVDELTPPAEPLVIRKPMAFRRDAEDTHRVYITANATYRPASNVEVSCAFDDNGTQVSVRTVRYLGGGITESSIDTYDTGGMFGASFQNITIYTGPEGERLLRGEKANETEEEAIDRITEEIEAEGEAGGFRFTQDRFATVMDWLSRCGPHNQIKNPEGL